MIKNSKLLRLPFLPISFVTAVLIFSILATDDPQKIATTIIDASPVWLIISILCYMAYWLIDAITLRHLINKLAFPKKHEYPLKHAIKVAVIGTLFSYLTPSATGGQPVQIHHLRKFGVPIGFASAALIIRFIVFQTVIVIMSLLFYIFNYQNFAASISGFKLLIIVGIILNVSAVIFFFIASILPNLAKKIAKIIVKIGTKIKLIKRPEVTLDRLETGINDFSAWPKIIKKDPKILLYQSLLSALQITFYSLVSFFIFKSISQESINPFLALTASLSIWMASSFIPLPGGSGGAESSFLLFFSTIYTHSNIPIALILWRFVSFYIPIFIGGIILVLDKKSPKIKPSKK